MAIVFCHKERGISVEEENHLVTVGIVKKSKTILVLLASRFLYYSGSLLYSRMNSLEFWYMFFSSDVYSTHGGYSSERRVIMLLGNYVPFLSLWNTEGIIDFNSGAN